jgi:hypothetical protein
VSAAGYKTQTRVVEKVDESTMAVPFALEADVTPVVVDPLWKRILNAIMELIAKITKR